MRDDGPALPALPPLPALPLRPRLKPWYRLSVDEVVVLRYGGRALELEGRAAQLLLPRLLSLLDGTHTVDELVAALGEPVRPAVERTLALLAEHGVLTEPLPDGLPSGRARTAELVEATALRPVPAAAAAGRLADTRVAVAGHGTAAERLTSLLADSGVGDVARVDLTSAPDAGLAVAAPADEELSLLEDWNALMIRTATPWLQLLPFDGTLTAVGPLYLPGVTACFRCYVGRRAASGAGGDFERCGSAPSSPALDAAAAGLAGLLVLRWLARGDGFVPAVLYALEQTPELSLSAHFVFRLPRCPACSATHSTAILSPWAAEAARAAA